MAPPFTGYAGQPYGGTYGQAPTTEGLATTALILSIGSFVCLSIFGSIPGLILARRAKRYIDASQGMKTGSGLATAATILSIINLVVIAGVVALLVLLAAAGNLRSSASFSSSDFSNVITGAFGH